MTLTSLHCLFVLQLVGCNNQVLTQYSVDSESELKPVDDPIIDNIAGGNDMVISNVVSINKEQNDSAVSDSK